MTRFFLLLCFALFRAFFYSVNILSFFSRSRSDMFWMIINVIQPGWQFGVFYLFMADWRLHVDIHKQLVPHSESLARVSMLK